MRIASRRFASQHRWIMAAVTAPLALAMLPAVSASAAVTTGSWSKISVTGIGQPAFAQETALGCASTNLCFSFGFHNLATQGHSAVDIAKRTASGWTATSNLKLPSDVDSAGDGMIAAVKCKSATFCIAVGTYTNSSQAQEPMATTFNGTSWSPAVTFGLPSDAGSNPQTIIRDVVCPMFTTCIAVGTYFTPSGYARALLATWTYGGVGWSTAVSLTPPSSSSVTQNTLASDVSCSSSSDCWIVGGYADGTRAGQLQPFYVNWFNGSLTAGIASPAPNDQARSNGTELSSIDCAGGSCVAVGTYQKTTDTIAGFAINITASGAGASTQPILVPSDTGSNPDLGQLSVGCSTTKCLVAGGYTTAMSASRGFVTPVFHGTLLTPVEFKFTGYTYGKRTTDGYVGPVACPSASLCLLLVTTSVGSFQSTATSGEAILSIAR